MVSQTLAKTSDARERGERDALVLLRPLLEGLTPSRTRSMRDRA